MNNLKFYVFSSNGVKRSELLMDCIRWYSEEVTTNTGYVALGISNGSSEVDIMNKYTNSNKSNICYDYANMDVFKDNKLISVNIVNKLKEFIECL